MNGKAKKYLQAGLVIGAAGVVTAVFPVLMPTVKIAAFGTISKIFNSY